MVDDGPYEILPYKEIAQLKRDIDDLKRRTSDVTTQDLVSNMSKLSSNMNEMMMLFKGASEQLKVESQKESDLANNVALLIEKLSESLDENKVIADGILALSENVENKFKKVNERIDKMHFQTTITKKRAEYNEPQQQNATQDRQEPTFTSQTKTFNEPVAPTGYSHADIERPISLGMPNEQVQSNPQFASFQQRQQMPPPMGMPSGPMSQMQPPRMMPQYPTQNRMPPPPIGMPPGPMPQMPLPPSQFPPPPSFGEENFESLMPPQDRKPGLLGRMFKKK